MARWLLKSEPNEYSWDDLVRDKSTTWDGVTNALALKHMRTIRKGDAALIYHTGDQRAMIGIAEVVAKPSPDPKESDPRIVVIDVKPTKKLARPVTLDEIRADRAFAGWDLLRNSRLSVVPVPEAMWNRIIAMARSAAR